MNTSMFHSDRVSTEGKLRGKGREGGGEVRTDETRKWDTTRKDRVERSRGIETSDPYCRLNVEVLPKIKPTDPLR